jgi:hypothetical protein
VNITEGKPQPAPLDEAQLSPEEVFTALRDYVLKHSGRQAHAIVGHRVVHPLGSYADGYVFTLSLKPKAE